MVLRQITKAPGQIGIVETIITRGQFISLFLVPRCAQTDTGGTQMDNIGAQID